MLDALKAMDDRVFENLAFDLLALSGVQNLVWRTPGIDGGRDLEGTIQKVDFSGHVTAERWYFECKRYSASVPWPIVHEKVAYAQNADAEYLLFITTSGLSPQCVDEVNVWNTKKRTPLIRQWPGHYLATTLAAQKQLSLKYGLARPDDALPLSTWALSLEIAKAAQAANSAVAFARNPNGYIELSACLADLMTGRISDYGLHAHAVYAAFRAEEDAFPWIVLSPSSGTWPVDRLAFRALLAALHVGNQGTEMLAKLETKGAVTLLTAANQPIALQGPLRNLVAEICFWGDLEVAEAKGSLVVHQRDSHVQCH